jgi:hypothetical protein
MGELVVSLEDARLAYTAADGAVKAGLPAVIPIVTSGGMAAVVIVGSAALKSSGDVEIATDGR